MTRVLSIEGLEVSFGGVTALSGLSFAAEEGEILGVIGPNGAGKTTCFNVISGLVRPRRGKVVLRGREITGLAPHRVTHLGVARTFQTARPFADMSVLENVMVGLRFGGGPARRDGAEGAARTLLDFVGVEEDPRRPLGECDFMTRRQTELARALATGPVAILLDEILAGLNPAEIEALTGIIRRIRSELGATVLWVEHIMDVLMTTASRVVVLHHGEMLVDGSPAEVARDPRVVEVYLGSGGSLRG